MLAGGEKNDQNRTDPLLHVHLPLGHVLHVSLPVALLANLRYVVCKSPCRRDMMSIETRPVSSEAQQQSRPEPTAPGQATASRSLMGSAGILCKVTWGKHLPRPVFLLILACYSMLHALNQLSSFTRPAHFNPSSLSLSLSLSPSLALSLLSLLGGSSVAGVGWGSCSSCVSLGTNRAGS